MGGRRVNETFQFDLPSPEGEDFGNGALQLQTLAEGADAQLWAFQQAFYNNLHKPAWLGSLNADMTGSFTQTNFGVPFNGNSNILQFGSFSTFYINGGTSGNITPPEQGSYMFGCYGNFIASGTVTANTLRTSIIGASVPAGPGLTTAKQSLYKSTAIESNTGVGVFITNIGTFDFQEIPFNPPAPLWWGFTHNNSGSNMTLKQGALFWWIKISELGA
jgi:hypothetical protein